MPYAKQSVKTLPETYNILPKSRNFAKSGHTESIAKNRSYWRKKPNCFRCVQAAAAGTAKPTRTEGFLTRGQTSTWRATQQRRTGRSWVRAPRTRPRTSTNTDWPKKLIPKTLRELNMFKKSSKVNTSDWVCVCVA